MLRCAWSKVSQAALALGCSCFIVSCMHKQNCQQFGKKLNSATLSDNTHTHRNTRTLICYLLLLFQVLLQLLESFSFLGLLSQTQGHLAPCRRSGKERCLTHPPTRGSSKHKTPYILLSSLHRQSQSCGEI